MVAAVGALRGGGAAELAAPQDERIFEQTTGLEVLQQGRDRLIDFGGIRFVVALQALVLVPLVGVAHLDEAHALFREAAGHQTLAAEVLRDGIIEPVHFLGDFAFLAEVLQIGRLGLHAEGEFKGFDAAFEGTVMAGEFELTAVEILRVVNLHALNGARSFGVADERNAGVARRDAHRADGRARVGRGQERGAEVVGAAVALRGADGEVAGHRRILRAQPIGDPGAHAGADEGVRTGVQFKQRAAVTAVGAVHGLDEADVVDVLGDLGEQVADPGAALAVLLKAPGRLEQVEGFAGYDLGAREGQGLAMVTLQERLVIEGVHLRRSAVHEEEDDALGAGGEVRLAHVEWAELFGSDARGAGLFLS